MTQKNWLPQFVNRPRAQRTARLREDPSTIFKTFVELLAQLRAEARAAGHTQIGAQAEKS